MATTVTYKNNTLVTVNNQTKTLKTAGKYLEDDITLVDISGSTEAISVQETADTGGGVVKNIVALDISDTTAMAADVRSGKYFYTAAGVKTEGTAFIGVDWSGLAKGTWPTGSAVLDSTVTAISTYKFFEMTGITSLSAPSVTSIGNNAFDGCTALTSISIPSVTSIGTNCFYHCYHLAGTIFPELTSIGSSAFYACNNGGGAWVFPKVTAIPGDCFRQLKASAVDLGPNCTSLGNRAFYQPSYGGYIPILILRRTDGVVTASATTSLEKINSDSKVYVPQALISSYEAATNWSDKGSIFYAIEGSQYENYYADGTPIPTT